MRKLYVYDSSSDIDILQANGRFDSSGTITTLGVRSVAELENGLRALIENNAVFDRVLFQTHGSQGFVYFNNEPLGVAQLRSRFTGGDYHKLFPGYTRMHFDGCNVADSEEGWSFLEAAARAFLSQGGGISFGWTSLGFGAPGWLPFIGGHTMHFTGQVRTVVLNSATGVVSRQVPSANEDSSWSNPNKVCCFPSDTPVQTVQGLRSIGALERNTPVYCWDGGKKRITKKLIQERQDHFGKFRLRVLKFKSGDQVAVTDKHYFSVAGLGWVASENIAAGDIVKNLDNSDTIVSNIVNEFSSCVHNIRVEGCKNYYIGESGLLVRDH